MYLALVVAFSLLTQGPIFSLLTRGPVGTLLSFGAQLASFPAGRWEGIIRIPERELGITVDLAKTVAGIWIGSISVPLSTSIDVPLGNISIDGTVVRFTATLPAKASFEGALTDGGTLSGTVSNADGRAPFELSRKGAPRVVLPPPSTALPPEFSGAWEGTLERAGRQTKVGVTLSSAPDGVAIGVLAASGAEIPLTTVTFAGADVRFESRAVSGTFVGTLGPAGDIAGEWAERSVRAPLVLRRADTAKK
jgi:hypothetical protein